MSDERQRIHVIFRKGEGARFLSHLDLMSTLEFSIRRAGIPVELSEGFNPRPRISLAVPLILGHIGEREILEMTLRKPVSPCDIHSSLQSSLPPGIFIHTVVEVPTTGKPAQSRVRSTTYRVDLAAPIDDLSTRVIDLLARETIDIEEHREGKSRARNIRPLIYSIESPNPSSIRLTVAVSTDGTIRPEQLLDLLRVSREGVSITREQVTLA